MSGWEVENNSSISTSNAFRRKFLRFLQSGYPVTYDCILLEIFFCSLKYSCYMHYVAMQLPYPVGGPRIPGWHPHSLCLWKVQTLVIFFHLRCMGGWRRIDRSIRRNRPIHGQFVACYINTFAPVVKRFPRKKWNLFCRLSLRTMGGWFGRRQRIEWRCEATRLR
jgi:hypothetical protein